MRHHPAGAALVSAALAACAPRSPPASQDSAAAPPATVSLPAVPPPATASAAAAAREPAETTCEGVTRADAAASPRPDADAELLALILDRTVIARGATYARVQRDLTAIRAAEPAFRSVHVLAGDVHEVEMAVRSGEAAPPSCLLDLLGVGPLHLLYDAGSEGTFQTIKVRARTNLRLLAEVLTRRTDPSQLAPVESAYPRGEGIPAWRLPEHGKICGHREAGSGDRIVYILDLAPSDVAWNKHVDGGECVYACRRHHAVIYRTDAAGAVTRVGVWRAEDGPAPGWYPETLDKLQTWCALYG